MDPIFLTVGETEIRWYSFLILTAVFLVYWLIHREAKRFKFDTEKIFDMMFWALIFGIIGARLYYVIFNYSELYAEDLIGILKVWEGGLAIHGGIIGGLLAVMIFCSKEEWKFLRVTDMIAVPLLLGQAIGRWGNFFNQEAHGGPVAIETLKNFHVPDYIIQGMTINEVTYIPTFLIESIVCFVAFLILYVVRRGHYVKVGTMTGMYLIIYGILRFFIEMTRTDALMLGGIKVAQVVSVVMLVIGIALVFTRSRKSRFQDLYNETKIG